MSDASVPRPEATASDREFLDWAELVFTGRCMINAGFEFFVSWARDADVAEEATSEYGSTDVAFATTYGYGLVKRPVRSAPAVGDGPNARYVQSLSKDRQAEYWKLLNGDRANSVEVQLSNGAVGFSPRDGCTSAGRRELYGDFDRWMQLSLWMTSVPTDAERVVLTDPRYLAAERTWAECMHAHGQPDNTAVEARKRATGLSYDASTVEAAFRAESAVAVADATCAVSSGLVTVAEQVDAEVRAALVATRPADAAEFDTTRGAALVKARELSEVLARTRVE